MRVGREQSYIGTFHLFHPDEKAMVENYPFWTDPSRISTVWITPTSLLLLVHRLQKTKLTRLVCAWLWIRNLLFLSQAVW